MINIRNIFPSLYRYSGPTIENIDLSRFPPVVREARETALQAFYEAIALEREFERPHPKRTRRHHDLRTLVTRPNYRDAPPVCLPLFRAIRCSDAPNSVLADCLSPPLPPYEGSPSASGAPWMSRKRKAISDRTKLAAALLALQDVPYEHAKLMTADQIISLYQFDHGIHHAIDPIDEPWNLTPRLIAPHKIKTKADVASIAKTKRIERKQAEHLERMKPTWGTPLVPWPWPKKTKIQSRGFPKKPKRRKLWGVGSRPL
jgi:hypothetical protein